jgi:uncharacterized protein (DUF58 family)
MADRRPQTTKAHVEEARSLAARLPELLVTARRIAANVMLGVHGRRRRGPGEAFWEFRTYVAGEPVRQIDWRRSARDDRHLYVREREWEASQSVWLWTDLSPSMDFRSDLGAATKLDRSLVLMLALAEMLGRGGERVGMPGLVEPRLGRDAAERLAAALLRAGRSDEWPSLDRVGRFADVVILSDCLSDGETMDRRIREVGGRGATLHLLQVFDPAEEVFPFKGRILFRDPETGELDLVERAETTRDEHLEMLAAHREAMRRLCRQAGFTFATHHTDRPAAEGLLSLHASLSGPAPVGWAVAAPGERRAA